MRKAKRVIIKRCGQKSTLYFRNRAHRPSKTVLQETIEAAIFANRCSYGDTKQLVNGEVSISFNPLLHSKKSRKELENELKTLIQQS